MSVVGFGCWAIGGKWWGDDVVDGASRDAVRRALELGIDWFDTAPLYGHGHADDVLLEALGADRDRVVIATKVGVRWDGDGEHAESDLTPAHVRQDAEASLSRLGLERIDLLQVHWPCERDTALDDTLAELERLREEGKVRAFGICNYGSDGLAAALDRGTLACFQTPYSMVRREFEVGLREVVCPELEGPPKVPVLAYETLCRGLLTGKFKTLPRFPKSDMRARDGRFWGPRFWATARWVDLLRQAGDRVGAPPAALAIAWVLSRPFVSCAIVGAKTAAQVEVNARAAELFERPRVVALLDRIAAAHRAG